MYLGYTLIYTRIRCIYNVYTTYICMYKLQCTLYNAYIVQSSILRYTLYLCILKFPHYLNEIDTQRNILLSQYHNIQRTYNNVSDYLR